jgi:hypothetical protein
LTAAKNRKRWNQAYYTQNNFCLVDFDSVATANAVVTTDSAIANSAVINGLFILAGVATAADPWLVNANGIVCTALARWSSHAVPHWERQTLQCAKCKVNFVPKKEAREDAAAEDILFHVFEYKCPCSRMARSGGGLSLFRSAPRLARSIASIMGPSFAAGATIPPATFWRHAVGGRGRRSSAVASAPITTLVRGCHCLLMRRYRAAIIKTRLSVSRARH